MDSTLSHDRAGTSTLMNVIEAVAEREGVDPMELEPPLRSVVDIEAVDRLFAPTKNGPRNGQVAFEYRGYTVRVKETGDVVVDPIDRPNGGGER